MAKKLLAISIFLWAIVILGFMAINQDAIKYAGEQKAVERVARARATTRFVSSLYETLAGVVDALAWLLVVGLAVAIVGGVAILVYSIIEKRWKNRHMAVNGVFPLRDQVLRLPDRSRATLTTNPNLLTAPQTLTIHTGMNVGGYQLPASFLGESAQLQAMQIGRTANNLQAMPAGRIGSGLYNAMQSPRPLRIIGGEDALVQPQVAQLPIQPMTVGQAFQQSTPTSWIVGRGMDGSLARFDTATDTHFAVIGATGTGKSHGVGIMMLGHALRLGWRSIVLDGKGGDDWSPFANLIEYHETAPDVFPDQVERLVDEYGRRRRGEVELHPMLVMIEEYGDTNDRMSRAQAERANGGLMTIIRKGRDVGMHLGLIDQYPDRWDAQLLQNTKAKFVYWLEDGAIVKQYKAHELATRGEFFFRGQKYRSFDMQPHVGRLLGIAAPVRYPALIDGECQQVEYAQERLSYDEPPVSQETGGGGKWDGWFARYAATHPEIVSDEPPRGTFAEAAREMARVDGGIKPYTDYKSVISGLVDAYRG